MNKFEVVQNIARYFKAQQTYGVTTVGTGTFAIRVPAHDGWRLQAVGFDTHEDAALYAEFATCAASTPPANMPSGLAALLQDMCRQEQQTDATSFPDPKDKRVYEIVVLIPAELKLLDFS